MDRVSGWTAFVPMEMHTMDLVLESSEIDSLSITYKCLSRRD
jgi:hypothetical protein